MNKIIEKLNGVKYFVLIKIFILIRPWIKKKKNTIVFVADYIKPRIVKIGYALTKKKYTVVLILNNCNIDSLSNDSKKYFRKVLTFADKEELYVKCLWFKPLVYHIFSEAFVGEHSEILIKNKSKIGKIVYDQYDVFKNFSRVRNRTVEKRERFCFENADGVCCRSFETQNLKHKYGYSFKRRLLFLDYCWNNFQYRNESKDDGNLKIIYGGRLLSSKSKDVLEKIEWEGFSYIASVMEKNQGYFVIVPLMKCDENYYKFIDLKSNNRYVKIKEPMSPQKLIRYESRMDYGIDCVEFQTKMDEYEKKFGKIYDYKSKARYYATNKYFDYIDAGIVPLYGRKNEMFGRYLARYGGAVPCSLEELPLKIKWLKENKAINKEQVKKARSVLAIDIQIDRLIKFYNEI